MSKRGRDTEALDVGLSLILSLDGVVSLMALYRVKEYRSRIGIGDVCTVSDEK